MSNEISVPQPENTSLTTSDAAFNSLAKGGAFLPRMQLYTKGKAINQRLIGPGEYGIPEQGDAVTVLGDEVVSIPLARRPKAIDMSDKEAIITNYDPSSPVFQDIENRSSGQDSGCMFGVSFLMWVPAVGQFLELFFGTKSSRGEAAKLYPFLPKGDKPAQPIVLSSRLIEKGTYSWHAPVVKPYKGEVSELPPIEAVVSEINKFLNPPQVSPEKVADPEPGKQRRAR